MLSDPLDTATTDPAAQQAYRQLERLIVTLELAPGTRITEGHLIARLGLGRTPVREAIQRLAWEGFFDIRPRAGITVAPLHPSDWLRVIDARRGVEIVLAASAARLMTESHAPVLQAAGETMQKAVAAQDVQAFMRADKAMDEAVALVADNPFAARLAGPLQTHSRRFWFRFQATSGLKEAGARHLDLLAAIAARDEERARTKAEDLMGMLRAHARTAATR
ncbi:MAG: GntR family transcriptional regulator [Methylobacterium mesophilicum]|nr:GntR family transcriptional regulator [Methylobacterium mesophilicum]